MSILHCGRHEIDLSSPCVMGIVNVTADSFSADGRLDREAALAHARRLLEDGAGIIDIGGESTRPGAAPVPEEVERERVIPIVEALAAQGAVVSVDTMKPAVMRAAVAAGASMINDVKAFTAPGAIEAIAGSDAALCLMHMQGEPRTMQQAPHYTDVVTEVRAFLAGRARACADAGIASDRIVVDPGFGFGKSVAHNLDLLRRLDAIVGLGFPVLAGLSRKSTLGALTGRDVGGRASASVAAALAAALRGARILRVHDVRETVDALAVWRAIEPWTGLQLRKGLE
ncbi:MAG: dihydropteroate synthase [Betaproteobacteria bacterium]|nr:dihydropteroate synthase [Betaproteobacteria bacterium]MDE2004067.1 dihydropteroate synthase [Betaproteobacteria bacterium]MDE2358703.1 dihydropteroate synthase [Betaproteobacteria bacterium]